MADGVRYGVPDPDWAELEVEDETTAWLRDLPARFEYLYDFGDGWEHDVEVLGRGGETPGCVEGTGDCPPEDCGGPWGYQNFLKAIGNKKHKEHKELLEWVGGSFDPEHFDLDEVNDLLGSVLV